MKKTPGAEMLHLLMAELGRRGGKARAKKVSKERLSAIGKQGAAARWKKGKKQ